MAVINTRQDKMTPTPADSGTSYGNPDTMSSNEKTPGLVVGEEGREQMYESAEETTGLKSTHNDAEDMQRMGKQQQLVRNYRLLSMTSFNTVLSAAWELGLFFVSPALTNGGSPGLLWTTFWNFICFGPIVASLAEMASMAPIAGAQYHWVSEFAPENCQAILSYLVGWVSTLAWQAGNGAGALLVGTLIQVTIAIPNPDYTLPSWHGTLLTIAVVAVSCVGNIFGNDALPWGQYGVFVLHIAAYIAIMILMWLNAQPATHSQVWLEFTNHGGWSSTGLAVLVGQLSAIPPYVGYDTAAHMSEEVKDASKSIPLVMLYTYLINFAIAFPVLVTLCYHLPDLGLAFEDPSEYPTVFVFRQSMSTNGVVAFMAVTTFLLTAANFVYLTTVTRDLFAFARDRGLPFSSWIAKVNDQNHVPANSCLVSSALAIALSLIYLGSSVAYYAITSLYVGALLSCYITSIGCCLWRRIAHPETMPPARFSLGRWGVPINLFAVIYSTWAFFWSFWPTKTPIDASSFNWSSVIFIGTVIFSLVYYYIFARHTWFGPVTHVKGRGIGTNSPS